jgi:peptide/nickel transport system permease protein
VLRFLVRRSLQGLVIVAIVATLSFALIHLAPGDPFTALAADARLSPEVRRQLLANYGLDRPLPEQFVRYLAGLVRGDLGFSISFQRPVAEVLAGAVPNTLVLMGSALVVSLAVGISLGVVQARRHGRAADRVIGATTVAIGSLPDFWLAIVLMLVFAAWLPIFPVSGMVDVVSHDYLPLADRIVDRLVHLVLPVATLVLLSAASIARFQRAALLDVLPEDWLRTARAKGLSENAVMRRHALRNALAPVITIVGLAFPSLLGGAVFVEAVYSWPGMGSLAVHAVTTRDYSLVMATAVVGSILVVAGGILADLLHAAADPRLRVS